MKKIFCALALIAGTMCGMQQSANHYHVTVVNEHTKSIKIYWEKERQTTEPSFSAATLQPHESTFVTVFCNQDGEANITAYPKEEIWYKWDYLNATLSIITKSSKS